MEYYIVVKKFISKSGKLCTVVVLEDGDSKQVSLLGWGDEFAFKLGATFADLTTAFQVGYKVLGTYIIK